MQVSRREGRDPEQKESTSWERRHGIWMRAISLFDYFFCIIDRCIPFDEEQINTIVPCVRTHTDTHGSII